MIVYADTSALVKLFVTEEGSEATRDMFRQAQAMGTGLLTRENWERPWPEVLGGASSRRRKSWSPGDDWRQFGLPGSTSLWMKTWSVAQRCWRGSTACGDTMPST